MGHVGRGRGPRLAARSFQSARSRAGGGGGDTSWSRVGEAKRAQGRSDAGAGRAAGKLIVGVEGGGVLTFFVGLAASVLGAAAGASSPSVSIAVGSEAPARQGDSHKWGKEVAK